MSAPFTNAMLALSPDSFWLCGESGATLADSVGGKNLTVTGTALARGITVPAPFIGVDPAIDFSDAAGWATISSPLTQIASNKFSVVGMFYANPLPISAGRPLFCASFSGGHVDPFYIFLAFSLNGAATRVVVDTTGTFNPFDTGTAWATGWHLLGMTYDGTTTTLWQNNVQILSGFAGFSGNVHDTMGSFSLNNIPALNTSGFAGNTKCGSVGYWHDHVVSSGEMATLYAAAQTAPAGPPQQLNPVSVSAALRV